MLEVVKEALHQDTVSPSGSHFMGISSIVNWKRHRKRRTASCSWWGTSSRATYLLPIYLVRSIAGDSLAACCTAVSRTMHFRGLKP